MSFSEKVRTTKLPVLIPILSNKNLNVEINDVVNGNDISTYDRAQGDNGEHKTIKYGNHHIITNRNYFFYQKNDS